MEKQSEYICKKIDDIDTENKNNIRFSGYFMDIKKV